MSIFAYYFLIIFLTNYGFSKIEVHVSLKVQQIKWGARAKARAGSRLHGAPIIKPPPPISKANFAYVCSVPEA